ncbi:MAG: hypothetical protein AB8H79_11620, partial [Myxococcota bacterium]
LTGTADAACSTSDSHEANNSYSAVSYLGDSDTWWPYAGSPRHLFPQSLNTSSTDPDWYGFRLAHEGSFSVSFDSDGPIRVRLYKRKADGTPSTATWFDTIVNGQRTFDVDDPDPTDGVDEYMPVSGYFVEVIGTGRNVCIDYTLSISVNYDEDGDKVYNGDDVCPDVYDPGQLDTDGDGIGNACDNSCSATVCEDGATDGSCVETYSVLSKDLEVVRSHDLDVTNSCIERAVVFVHGSSRNTNGGFESIVEAADNNGMKESTLVVAPWYRAVTGDDPDCDPATNSCDIGAHYWTSAGWMQGDDGHSYLGSPQVLLAQSGPSSFAVHDALIDEIISSGKFPNLKEVVLTGHSAGGQFTQRYALFGLEPNDHPNVGFTYLPANAGSYTLVSPEGLPAGTSSWLYSSLLAYKHGLFSRSGTPYTQTLSSSTSEATTNPYVSQYLNRNVTYLIGDEDTCGVNDQFPDGSACDHEDNSVPDSVNDVMQGNNRLDRAHNVLDHLDAEYGTSGHLHSLIEIRNAEHSTRDMYPCDETPGLLFDLNTYKVGDDCP